MAQGKYAREQQDAPRRKRPSSFDKRFYLLFSLLAVVVALLTFCTCILLAKTAQSAPAETSSQESTPQEESSSDTLSDVSSEDESSSQESASSEAENASSGAASSAGNTTVTVDACERHPLSAALEQSLGKASNNIQLLNAYETALNAWKDEIAKEAARLKRVLPDADAFTAEQTAWEEWAEKTFAASEEEGEGSNAPLNLVREAYEAYRARAQELYVQLVKYEPDYTIE